MQDVINGLLVVLVPMLLGYLLKVKSKNHIIKINQIVMFLLYVILFLMGYLLGQLDDLEIKLPIIGKTAATLSAIILTSNMIGLMIYDRFNPAPLLNPQGKITSRLHSLVDSFKLSSTVVLGTLCGWLFNVYLVLPAGINLYALIALIFFVGIQLRNNGISLKEALFNKRGFQTGMVFTITSLFGGIVAALVLTMPITQGLAFASGMGWYSLSSVVLTNAWGPIQGSIAFFNDLSREIISLFIVPIFMQHFRSTAIGITGATALDCTLPIIQKSGGIEVTPIAISFGVVTNILPPVLLVLFSGIPI
ncbi:lysine exporter LysO family protein [Rodentibacter pneumotropicus]|uniref:lysine exporter LysO family protein n=1 Tax=Rodentibacter pneumotropicus TaxID=758 RepID=UPI00232D9574|nr:lysine exporter LysO family protein [Rodentibacter pneumotropicus]MDC2824695.1 lysine exporter LysO family protein [Rodentibacter pneumotropicus]